VRVTVVAAAAVVLAGAAGLAVLLVPRSAPAATTATVPIGTARVTRTDIVSTGRVNGTLGYGAIFTVSSPGGTTAGQLEQAQAAVAGAQAGLDAALQAGADTAAANQLAVAQAQAAATTATGGAVAQAQDQLATAQQHARQTQHQADAAVTAARVQLRNAQAALQLAQATARLDGDFTWLPAPGAAIQPGQPLYAVDGHPVVLLQGSQPAYRQLCPGVSGDDVRQLEEDLIGLGFASPADLAADGRFTGADAAAVRRWQAALGVPETGAVRLGEVVFANGPVRVAAVRVGLGTPAGPGTAVLDLTATRHAITAQVDAVQQQLVHQGDQVSVLLPDGRTSVAGTVSDVSRVATVAQSQGQGPGQVPGGGPQATVAVTIALADESAAGTLDQAPVYVSITTASRRSVLAVPVTALLAQPDGSYAVAVRSGGERHLVAVQPGLYSDSGLVLVGGAGLQEGQLVEVPAQ
jgi:multidrug efflux system membrane fusion protein